MIRGGSAFLDDVCNRLAVIGEEDSMGSDHHFTSTDGPPSPPYGGRSALGLVPQLEAGPLGPLRPGPKPRGRSGGWPPGGPGFLWIEPSSLPRSRMAPAM